MASRSQDNPEKVVEQSIKSVQEQSDAETDQGFAGTAVDPTPRENYTVAGVTSGAPTPETDEGAAEAARKAVATPR
jgi:hypothetical protein